MLHLTAYKPSGPVYLIAPTATSSTAVTISAPQDGSISNLCAFMNTGSVGVQITMVSAAQGQTAPPAVLPAAGVPQPVSQGTGFFLQAGMTTPLVLVVPQYPFSITTIGTAAGPGVLYITPITDPQ